MKFNLKNFGKKIILMLVAVTIWAATTSTTLSAQTSGTGLDGYTRVFWQGADSSIVVWKLDGNLNVVSGVTDGPYAGWVPLGLTVGDDNYTRIIWRSTGGQLATWLLDPNLNYVAGNTFGPFAGWLPVSTSLNSGGYEWVIWRHTLGYMAVWVLSPNQSQIIETVGFTNSGYTPGQESAFTTRESNKLEKSATPGQAGAAANGLPDELTPHFKRLPQLPQAMSHSSNR